MTQVAILKSERTVDIIKIFGGVLVMSIAAQVAIPLKPVPIILHTMVLMVIGLTYTPKLAMSTMAAYLLTGAIGIPVFSNFNAGLPYMIGPTGGYLAGFLIAPTIMAYCRQRYPSGTISAICICLLGNLLLYTLGVAWLSYLIGFEKAFYSGFVVFIPSGIAKIAVLVVIMRYLKIA